MPENQPIKLLIVDDEPGIVDFTKKIYARKDFLTFGATDGVTAVDVFKNEHPQICLIDIHMPYSPIDGIETLRRIKQLDPQACCIMITRITENEPVKQAKELGAFRYVTKPLDIEDLDKVIEEAKAALQNG
jgi:two-component system response regulator (stage 0 sporulation protein F)